MKERLKQRKEELGMTTASLAKLSGVPVGTINKILTGETKSPRLDTLLALEKVLFPGNAGPTAYNSREESTGAAYSYSRETSGPANCVREASFAYAASRWEEKTGKQDRYTVADYDALPDDVRAELIDGELIYMEAPDLVHQFVSTELSFLLTSHIRQKQGNCLVFTAPLDVQLDCDDRTIVQPDVLVSCRREQRITRGIFGAPDMVIEITSPSTRKRDYTKKMVKYLEAGVREYWIVDLQKKIVITYFFEEDFMPHIYPFESPVPVSIFNGECCVELAGILKRLDVAEG